LVRAQRDEASSPDLEAFAAAAAAASAAASGAGSSVFGAEIGSSSLVTAHKKKKPSVKPKARKAKGLSQDL
jgi:hypothetical protein